MEAQNGMDVDGMEDVNMADYLVEEIWQTLNYDMPAQNDATLDSAGDQSQPPFESSTSQTPWEPQQSMTPTGYEATLGTLLEAPAPSLNNDNNQGFPPGNFNNSEPEGYQAAPIVSANQAPQYPSSPQTLYDGPPSIERPIIQGGVLGCQDTRGVNRPSIPAGRSTGLLPSGYTPATHVRESRFPSPLPTGAISPVAPPQRQQQRLWAYAFDVLPCNFQDPAVLEHTVAIGQKLDLKRLGDFRFELIQSPAFSNQTVRRFILPKRLRQDDRTRLLFMQVFNGTRQYNSKLPGYEFKMVQVFEPRQFHTPTEDYQAIAGLAEEDGVDGLDRFTDHDIGDLAAYATSAPAGFPSPEAHPDIDLPHLPGITSTPGATLPTPKDDNDLHAGTQRSKPIPKPDRDVRKNALGKYECTWPDCTEDQKSFNRKCEWNKHMDKHERPYKCLAEGCEKLAGFTYSGGLLRHEREVHSKHGGPRNPLNCPHLNCKRHSGKGFSRLENLNEHLRRVHTNLGPLASGDEAAEDGESVAASSEPGQQALPTSIQFSTNTQPQTLPSPQIASVLPQKRLLDDVDEDGPAEVKRLRKSEETLTRINAELNRQLTLHKQEAANAALTQESQQTEIEAQKRQIMAMMGEMQALRNQLAQADQQNTAMMQDAFQ